MDDEQILAASVGEPPPTYKEVVLAEYDPQWPNWFARAEEQIRGALGDAVLRLDHVGSTAVPGLAAKEWKYVQNYADAKSEVVQEILARAL